MNPNKLGNESEFNSEMNPTYNNTIKNNNTIDNKEAQSQKPQLSEEEKAKEERLLIIRKKIGISQFKIIKSGDPAKMRSLGNKKFEIVIDFLEYRNKIGKPFKTLNGIETKIIKPFRENDLAKIIRVVNFAKDEEYLKLNWDEDWKGQSNYKNGIKKESPPIDKMREYEKYYTTPTL